MTYLDRLIEDTGISIPSASAISGALPATESAAVESPESIDTIEMGPPSPASSALPAVASVIQPGSVQGRPILQEPAVPEVPAVDVRPLSLPSVPAPVPTPALGSQPASPRQPPERDIAFVPAAEGAEALTPALELPLSPEQRPVEEASSSQRALRTLAAVREWTSATPEPGEGPSGAQPLEQAALVAASDSSREPLVEVVQAPPMRNTRIQSSSPSFQAGRDEPASRPPDEPEVVNFSVSIGAIEVTVEGPQPLRRFSQARHPARPRWVRMQSHDCDATTTGRR